jgi:hypothetical protein
MATIAKNALKIAAPYVRDAIGNAALELAQEMIIKIAKAQLKKHKLI